MFRATFSLARVLRFEYARTQISMLAIAKLTRIRLCQPIYSSDDFIFYHSRPPSSILEEPSSTDDRTYVSSETSWVPDSDEDCNPRKISRKGSYGIPDSDTTIVSFTGINESINASEASRPPLIRNYEFSNSSLDRKYCQKLNTRFR